MSTPSRVTLREFDNASSEQGPNVYILSTTKDNDGRGKSCYRLDKIPQTTHRDARSTARPSSTGLPYSPAFLSLYLTTTVNYLKILFLPTGYPHTVTSDYAPYQIYDSVQAFASTIASLLSSRAVLQSINVVSQPSSPEKSHESIPASSTEAATAATLLSILQSTLSNFTTILFASHAAPRISPDVKFYRFLADVVNDAAFVLDLLAPSLPTSFNFDLFSPWFLTPPFQLPLPITPRVLALCTSSMLRATCGVAAGSSKAVLSAHFARSNPENVGDLNAKDGSQETIINLLGMWVGGVVVSRVDGIVATWIWMLGLLGVHLWANYQAVRSVRLRGLNRERAGIVVREILAADDGWESKITFQAVGAGESVLGFTGIFARFWTSLRGGPESEDWRKWRLGVSVQEFMASICESTRLAKTASGTMKLSDQTQHLPKLLHAFEGERYIPWVNGQSGRMTVVFKQGVCPREQLKACFHVSMVVKELRGSSVDRSEDILALIIDGRQRISDQWNELCRALEDAGWDLDSVHLEDGLGYRLEVD